MKKSPLYTRTGDRGTTALVDGSRVAKNSPRLEAYGTVDELNATIGNLIASAPIDSRTSTFLTDIQSRLFDIGSYLATDAGNNPSLAESLLPQLDSPITRMESEIDRLDSQLQPLHKFVLPQGTQSAAAAHLARTVCRRAERRILDLADTAPVSSDIIRYINRLSDYLFVLARFNNHLAHTHEIFWEKSC